MIQKFNIDHLNQPLVIEEKVQEPDGGGGFKEIWREVGTTWGAVAPYVPQSTSELWRAGEHKFTSRYRIWVRGQLTLTMAMRFLWFEEIYEIIAAPVYIQNREFQTVMVERREYPQ